MTPGSRARRHWPSRALDAALTTLLVTVFVLSASYKIAYPAKIPEVLAKLPALGELGEKQARLLAGAVLGLEAFVAAGLTLRFSVSVALWVALVLCLAFALLVAPWFERLGGDCGCLWLWLPLSPTSGLELIARNVILAGVAAWLLHRRAVLADQC